MVSCSNLKIASTCTHATSPPVVTESKIQVKEVSFEKGFRITRQERKKIEEKDEKYEIEEIGEIKLTEEKEEIEDVPKMS